MTLTLYRSTDVAAPQLTGQSGSLIALLDAVLVTGYGSGGSAKAPAGWAKTYVASDGFTAAYRPAAGNRLYLQVADSGAGADTTKSARVRGYEAMSDAVTGIAAFPTTAQNSALPIVVLKSQTTDGTYRPWIAVATATYLYLFVDSGASAGSYAAFFWGDIDSYRTGGDPHGTAIVGRYQESYSNSGSETLHLLGSTLTTTLVGHYICRPYTDIGGSLQNMVAPSDTASSQSVMGGGQLAVGFNGPDGGFYSCSAEFFEAVAGVPHRRGRMPGLRIPCHNRAVSGDSVVTGLGGLSGHSYLAVNLWGGNGQVLVEIPA